MIACKNASSCVMPLFYAGRGLETTRALRYDATCPEKRRRDANDPLSNGRLSGSGAQTLTAQGAPHPGITTDPEGAGARLRSAPRRRGQRSMEGGDLVAVVPPMGLVLAWIACPGRHFSGNSSMQGVLSRTKTESVLLCDSDHFLCDSDHFPVRKYREFLPVSMHDGINSRAKTGCGNPSETVPVGAAIAQGRGKGLVRLQPAFARGLSG